MPTTLLTKGRLSMLSGWHASRRTDLASHIQHFGPLPSLDDDSALDLIAAIDSARLGGRGGAGFPAAIKVSSGRKMCRGGTLVVNAMEGEPASSKDRVLLSCTPHLVLDGAQLVAGIVGASRVVVCVASQHDDPAAAMTAAISERLTLGSPTVPFELVRPPGRYVAGEESALVDWVGRGRGAPTFRPEKGTPLQLRGRPAMVHNAETLAQVALIARSGITQSTSSGSEDEVGTCLVTVSGAVDHPGVYEVELGSPISEIIDRAQPAAPPAAALIGGYGGTWIRREHLGTPFSNGALAEIGASRGAGVLVVLTSAACGIGETARIAAYMAGQSAGQCGPCVFGLPAMADRLRTIAVGNADERSVTRLVEQMATVTGRGACRHPDGVVRMVSSALDVFETDVQRHVSGQPCPHHRSPSVMPLRDN